MVRASVSKGRGFDFRPFRFHVTTLGKLFTQMHLSPSSMIRYRSRVGDVMRLGR